jgi:hypothetical protein
LEYFDINTGTMSLAELTELVKEKEREKDQMKQKILRRKLEKGIDVEKKMREQMNTNTINILLERANQSTNPEVQNLYLKLKALRDVNYA